MYRQFAMLIILYASMGLSLKAQSFTSLYQADSVTYDLYLKEQWKDLAMAGNNALNEGIDFYYLRLRLGIAYFKMENYQQAIRHFEKASANNASDALLMEYLYYARLYAGRRNEALYGAKSFSAELKKYTGTEKPKWIRQVDVMYNQNFVDNFSAIEKFSAAGIPSDEDGGQFISDGHKYFYVGLKHELSPSISYYHAYTGLSKNHFAYVQKEGLAGVNKQAAVTLNQYYGVAQLRVANNLQWLAGLHYINLQYPAAVVQSRQGRDVLVWQNTSNGERVFFTGFAWQTTGVNALAMMHTANFNGREQLQADALLTVYPLGNPHLYFSGQVSYLQETLGHSSRTATIFEPLAGGKISEKIWIDAYGAFGPQQNYIAAQGAVLFNSLDRVTSRVGARMNFFPASKIKLLFEGVWLQSESTFQGTDYVLPTYNPISYNSFSITGGLSWYF